jgi:flagellar hook-length control protein FliK
MNDLALHSKVPAGSELSDMIDQKVVNSDLQTEFTTINIPASDLEHERNGGHSIAEVEHALQGLNPTDWSVKISNLQQAPMIKPLKSEESDVAAQQVDTVEAPMLDSTLEASELKKPDETQPKMEASSSFEHGLEGGNRVSDSVRFDQLNKDQEAIEDEASLEPEVSIKTNTSGTVGLTSTNVGETHPKESGDGFVIDPKQQIARSVLEVKDTLLPKDVKTLTLSLNPEALGQVNIELVSDEAGKVHVNLVVLKAETFETLQQDFSQLKTILNEIGIEDGNVSLQLSSGGEDHRHQQNAEYVAWEDRESMLVRPSEAASIPVEKMPTYPERKSHKRLDIRA